MSVECDACGEPATHYDNDGQWCVQHGTVSAPREEDVEALARVIMRDDPPTRQTLIALAREVARLSGERDEAERDKKALRSRLIEWERDYEAAATASEGERERLREALEGIAGYHVPAGLPYIHSIQKLKDRARAALSAGAEQEEPDAADMADPHWSGGHPHA